MDPRSPAAMAAMASGRRARQVSPTADSPRERLGEPATGTRRRPPLSTTTGAGWRAEIHVSRWRSSSRSTPVPPRVPLRRNRSDPERQAAELVAPDELHPGAGGELEHDGWDRLVAELVQGRTMREVLIRRRPSTPAAPSRLSISAAILPSRDRAVVARGGASFAGPPDDRWQASRRAGTNTSERAKAKWLPSTACTVAPGRDRANSSCRHAGISRSWRVTTTAVGISECRPRPGRRCRHPGGGTQDQPVHPVGMAPRQLGGDGAAQ